MTRTFAAGLAVAFALIATACDAPSTTPVSAPPATTTASPPAATTVAKGLDCTTADGDVETMICRDPLLIGLDSQLATAYQQAVTAPGADRAALQSAQDTWRSRRDDCWKADDVHGCVLAAYRTRLVDLQTAHRP